MGVAGSRRAFVAARAEGKGDGIESKAVVLLISKAGRACTPSAALLVSAAPWARRTRPWSEQAIPWSAEGRPGECRPLAKPARI